MACPVDHAKQPQPPPGECPMVVGSGSDGLDLKNLMPADLHKQLPSPGQRKGLTTERMKSSIPKEAEGQVWEYPSPQMVRQGRGTGVSSLTWSQFYNAMKRKGWRPNEDDMNVIVAIHNAVNEKAWAEVARVEKRLHPECACGPKLVSIRGLSSQLSPKARLYAWLGYEPPFDRHDWVVDRCGQRVRYVIDYYDEAPPEGKVAGLYMDVRPALDSAGAAWDRFKADAIRRFGSFQ